MTFGPALYTAVAAADDLEKRFGISAELIDFVREPLELRAAGGVRPQDRQGAAGVRRGGARLRNANRRDQPDSTLLRRSGRTAVVVGARNWITPAPELAVAILPAARWLLDAIHERILPLKGYQPQTNQTLGNGQRSRLGGIGKLVQPRPRRAGRSLERGATLWVPRLEGHVARRRTIEAL